MMRGVRIRERKELKRCVERYAFCVIISNYSSKNPLAFIARALSLESLIALFKKNLKQ